MSSGAAVPIETVGTIADAPSVVLYTCTFTSQVAAHALAALRDFAVYQGWTVVHEVYDLAPLDSPRRRRTGWRTVEHALSRGDASGLLAPAEQEIAWYPGDRMALRTWLLSVPAFAAYPQAGPRSLALTSSEGGAETASSVIGAPVDRQWSRSYLLAPRSLRRIRSEAFTHLTILGWPGDIVAAVEVLARLACNAIDHGKSSEPAGQMDVLLAVTEADELRIDVRDPSPDFPDSQAAIGGEKGGGLREVRLLGAEVTWSLAADGHSKTVRALLTPGEAQ
ncbi:MULTISPECIES: ATP-binding protein [unclassified Streptomyces]|uniref:ATP-binding protein n=1 Tax=unclassified Streptomyces TaxID=2593676 RepID=UPI002365E9A8|nr:MULTISPECIES: ATP-binding protein [unclassified Streptomyces]MDF3141078.1 ATP-binding protein [Streptomyces sp. T21Q-yed]WDF45063.1 ATP-binding protein [Streptomyces sp. T12]